jgi:hypothetical protein
LVQHKRLDPDPAEMNADPQPCLGNIVLIMLIIEGAYQGEGGFGRLQGARQIPDIQAGEEGSSTCRLPAATSP